MYFQHIYEDGLAQASYFIGCQKTKEAIVIDPRRDIDVYLRIAEEKNFNITHVTETHIHADFLSGARELAAATGAEMLLSDEGDNDWQYQFDHTGLKNGDVIKIGKVSLEVMHTPGHTPEHISFLLTDNANSSEPVMIFTGDFVFVGDIGRPDLLEKAAGITGTQEIGARQMFQSLKKFKSLADHVQVWPGHGAGSACGKSLGAVPSSTVGYEKLVNWALNIEDEEEFVEKLLEGQPEPPKYFAMMKKLNKFGPTVLGGIPHPAKLTLNQFREALEKKVAIVDSRDKLSFAGGHVRGSLNIQDNNEFSTWAGWMLQYDEPFVLIAHEERVQELTKALVRIGMQNFYGYVSDLDKWADQCHELETVSQITVNDLRQLIDKEGENIEIIDVRSYVDYNEAHIPNSKNIHTGYIMDNLDEIPKDKRVVVYCQAGNRSSIAASTLLSSGFKNIVNLTGGYSAWELEKLSAKSLSLN
ncbi:MAG: MBL fold metallo-hydrolase [Melioribacteraceae bacterium]|nr:MBL fold metallo-hydrolase [Melioribacteraceae bacterium]